MRDYPGSKMSDACPICLLAPGAPRVAIGLHPRAVTLLASSVISTSTCPPTLPGIQAGASDACTINHTNSSHQYKMGGFTVSDAAAASAVRKHPASTQATLAVRESAAAEKLWRTRAAGEAPNKASKPRCLPSLDTATPETSHSGDNTAIARGVAFSPATCATGGVPFNEGRPVVGSSSRRDACVIYVLQCEQGKYYVGRAATREACDERWQRHKSGRGAVWTRMYRPIRIIETFESDNWHEELTVARYMAQYGQDNVRGGMFSQPDLTDEQRRQILTWTRSVQDACFRCGAMDHFASMCPNAAQTQPHIAPQESVRVERRARIQRFEQRRSRSRSRSADRDQQRLRTRSPQSVQIDHQPWPSGCSRCGRTSHHQSECFAVTDVSGAHIDSEGEDESEDEDDSEDEDEEVAVDLVCYRCGRPGHLRSQCCAWTHSSGRRL